MFSKGIIGGLLIALAVLLLMLLRWLTGDRKDAGTGDAKTFQMPHDFPDKALIEKEITDGMEAIPATDKPDSDHFEADSYFINNDSDNKSPPTDSF